MNPSNEFWSFKRNIRRKMEPYGEQTDEGTSRETRRQGRWESKPGGFYKTTLSEWKRIKRQIKKRARRQGKNEITEQS